MPVGTQGASLWERMPQNAARYGLSSKHHTGAKVFVAAPLTRKCRDAVARAARERGAVVGTEAANANNVSYYLITIDGNPNVGLSLTPLLSPSGSTGARLRFQA